MPATAAGSFGGTTRKKAKKANTSIAKKYANLQNRIKNADLKTKDAMGAALNVAEIQGACFLAGMARGYMGAERFTLMGQDLALITGAGVTGFGLYQALRGKKVSGHVLAAGNGLLAAGLVGVGENLGARMQSEGLFGGILGGAPKMAGQIPAREAFVTPNAAGRAGLRPPHAR